MNYKNNINREEENSMGTIVLDKIGKCKLRVYHESKSVHPHFHIISEDGQFESCLYIYESKYFYHRNFKTDHLSDKQLKELCNQLKEIYCNNITKWQASIASWVLSNGTKFCSDDTDTMPDYTNIKRE